VDFVLYDPRTTAIVGIIELDDPSHRRRERRRRDRFLNESLSSAKVPLLRIKTAKAYDLTALRNSIAQISARNSNSPFPTPLDSQNFPLMQHQTRLSP